MATYVTAHRDGGSLVRRTSPRTGALNSMVLAESPDRLVQFFQGEIPGLIQDIFPDLSNEEREFLMTGYTPEDWAIIFPPEPGEEDL